MTPQEAMDQVVKGHFVKAHVVKGGLRQLFDLVASTAHDNETRRCAARVQRQCAEHHGYMPIMVGKSLANDLLITGGLKVEE